MTLQQSKYAPAILRHFAKEPTTSAFLDVFANVLERAILNHEEDPESDLEDHISTAIDDSIIYYDDQWEIMKHYQNPQNANLTDAIDYLYMDLSDVALEISKNQ